MNRMRFLGIGDSCDLGALYLRLQEDGHEVRVAIGDPMCHGTMAGMVPRAGDWRAELDWVRQAGADGIILFENVAKGSGAIQDELRRDGFQVIGGSAYGDRLENDRAYGQSVLAGLGLPICRTWEFDAAEPALAFLDAHPGRYVLKFNGPGFASKDNYVGQHDDGRDVRAVLAAKLALFEGKPVSFILMEHAQGIEMGVGAYFDGKKFLEPACLDWEHKRFFGHNLGELTGEMGTVVTYDRTHRFFERTLGRVAPLLRENGYLGYVNLNTIVNERGIWPLEFTCRFGYPGFAILDPLQETSWAALFRRMATGEGQDFRTRAGFCVGLVISTPPFPYNRHDIAEAVGMPVLFEGEMNAKDRRHLHYGEVGMQGEQLVTSGVYGWTMVVTGEGPDIAQAKAGAYELASRVFVPNHRYRPDIGDRLISGDLVELERLGVFDPA